MAARISEIFLYKESRNGIFLIKNPNLTKKKKSGGWEGRSGGVARVRDFFFLFSKESKSEKKYCFLLRG